MSANPDETLARPADPVDPGATVVRAAPPPAPPSATDETLVRGTPPPASAAPSAAQPLVSSGSAGFAEETRQLLRKRLILTHAAVGTVTLIITLLGLVGAPPISPEAGLGRWVVGLPLLVAAQNAVGLYFLLKHANANLGALRAVEAAQFGGIALSGAVARFVMLTAPPQQSPDPRFHDLSYRFAAVLTGFPMMFAVVFYGVFIPNTRRRSLKGSLLLAVIPVVATALAALVNSELDDELVEILPATVLPLLMSVLVAVFCAARANELARRAYDALREAKELGSYVLVRKLGEGGMGEVWLAEHRLLKRPCAMKFVRAELAAEPATAARFEREVRAVTALTHFNTVRIYDYGRDDDGSFYYVMEYLEGPTLDRLVKDRGPLAPGRAVYLVRQLCGALAEAHAAGMVHRDLKPNNVIVAALGGQRDVAKLLDFGLVQDHTDAPNDDRITRAGTVLGTPAYMCPEQAAGERVDRRGDVYSLGALAFFALTGRPPFEGNSAAKLMSAHLTQPPPDARAVRADAPADLAAVLLKCMAKDPNARYQSIAELEAALAECACAAEWSATTAAEWWTAPTDPNDGGDKTDTDRTTQWRK
jgi:eukaryotic-like serine/threonine-protein kinase